MEGYAGQVVLGCGACHVCLYPQRIIAWVSGRMFALQLTRRNKNPRVQGLGRTKRLRSPGDATAVQAARIFRVPAASTFSGVLKPSASRACSAASLDPRAVRSEDTTAFATPSLPSFDLTKHR